MSHKATLFQEFISLFLRDKHGFSITIFSDLVLTKNRIIILRAPLKTRFAMRNRYFEKGQGILANLPQM